ncbi:MAG: RagB/SusD family nutrient uptake outer membrane protein [Bacteroidota bacterium]
MKYIKILSVALSVLFLVSCDKDFLEKSPPDKLSEEGFINSADRAKLAVNGIYQQLQVSDLYGDYLPKFIGVPAGEILLSNTQPLAINNFSFDASDTYMLNIYAALYQGIKRSNTVLAEVPAVQMDKTLQDRYLGEAKFLRAFYYWNLTNMWGDVIMITGPVKSPDDVLIAKSPQADVYKLIIKDLQEAIPVLPVSYSSTDVGRITKGAAQAMLGKMFLYTKDYTQAESLLGTVINTKTYDLMPVFDQIWNRNFENNKESLFEVQFADIGGSGTSSRNGAYLPGVNGGTGSSVATPRIVSAFPAGDPRLGYSIYRNGDVFAPNLTTQSINLDTYKSTWSATGFNIRKGMVPILYLQGAGTNYPVIRFADVLLMYAEAANEVGKLTEARDAVNRVRQRPTVNVPALTAANTGTKATMFTAIMKERELELAFENHRFSDLRRWGLAETVLGPLGYLPKHKFFPLPQLEIDINPQLKQNTGW